MSVEINAQTMQTTLQQAWDAHKEFQTVYLKGKYDEQWAMFYAAFVIGRLGDLTTPSRLTELIEEVQAEKSAWTAEAAAHIVASLAAR